MDIDLRHEIHQVQSALDDLYEEAARQIIGIAGAYAEDDDDPDVPSYADAVVDEVVASIQRSVFDIEGATANKIAVRGMIYKAIAARVNELDQTGDEMVYRIGTEEADGNVYEGYNPCKQGFSWSGVRLMYIPS